MTATQNDIIEIEDLRASAPIEPGKLGHHTVLNTDGVRVIVLAFERGYRLGRSDCPTGTACVTSGTTSRQC